MRWAWIAGGALLFAALAAAWRYTPLSQLLTPETVRECARVVRETPWAPVALVLLYTPAAFVLFPRTVLTLVAVLAYGAWLGFGLAITGILISAYVAYAAGRLVDPRRLERLAGRYVAPVRATLQRHGVLAVFVLRVVPTAPHVVASAFAGALRVRAWHFGLGTFLGMLPGVLATSVFGGQVANGLEDPSRANYWLAGGAVVAFLLVMWALRRWAIRR
ncbi:MAG TPA: VTT domain-containing protein [Burkholderiales bacterium]|nr:VTT domain-containing protein [Burkholderiales bacterium]